MHLDFCEQMVVATSYDIRSRNNVPRISVVQRLYENMFQCVRKSFY